MDLTAIPAETDLDWWPTFVHVFDRDVAGIPSEMISAGDVSACTFGDIMRWRTENMATAKQIRADLKTAVNKRLARQITFDQYQSLIRIYHVSLAECKRRRQLISDELVRRLNHQSSRDGTD